MTEIRWPMGRTIVKFAKECEPVKELLLTGKVLALDPATKFAGWAYASGGTIEQSGEITLPATAPIAHRLQAWMDELTQLPMPDVLLIEKLVGRHVHEHLSYAVGVAMASVRCPTTIQVPVSLWKPLAKVTEGYVKSDEADARMLLAATLMYVQEEL